MNTKHVIKKGRVEIQKISFYNLDALRREREALRYAGWKPRGRVEKMELEYGTLYYQFMERPYVEPAKGGTL